MFAAVLVAVLGAAPAAAIDWEWILGEIDFPTSTANAEAQARFDLGVKLFHNFAFPYARDEFAAAAALDDCYLMAYWGEAMTFQQGLWGTQDFAAGQAMLPVLEERLANCTAPSAKESALIAAVQELWNPALVGAAGKKQRDVNYMNAMADAYAMDPDDVEIATLYVLSLMTLAEPGVRNFTRRGEAELALAASIIAPFEDVYPQHPGVAHYIIHVFDTPEDAPRAVNAAHQYSRVAPSYWHPQHMPTHIFLRLGDWEQAAIGNEVAVEISHRFAFLSGLGIQEEDGHSFEFLQYIYLQQGRFRSAEQQVATYRALSDPDLEGYVNSRIRYQLMYARYILETQDWASVDLVVPDLITCETCDDPDNIDGMFIWAQQANSLLAFAIGMAAAARGESTADAFTRLASLRAATAATTPVHSLEILMMEEMIQAVELFESGDLAGAFEVLELAVANEEATNPPAYGAPFPPKPPSELYGELVVRAGAGRDMYAKGLAMFQSSLASSPSRGRTLLGLARLERQEGDVSAARHYFEAFADQWRMASFDQAELVEALEYLDANPAPGDDDDDDSSGGDDDDSSGGGDDDDDGGSGGRGLSGGEKALVGIGIASLAVTGIAGLAYFTLHVRHSAASDERALINRS